MLENLRFIVNRFNAKNREIAALTAENRRIRMQNQQLFDDKERLQKLADRVPGMEREIRDIKWIKDDLEPVGPTLAAWLKARIAHETEPMDVEITTTYHRTTAELERVLRRFLVRPGMRGSWGRGVTRTWECEFDPTGGGCECAGGGFRDEECRDCFYRPPVGDKKANPEKG